VDRLLDKTSKASPALKPAALYLRRSTDKQEQSIDDQRAFLERYADQKGFEIVAEFVDDGISGTSAKGRASFQRMIHESQTKAAFRFVLCYSISRFSRGDVDEAGHFRFLLRQRGVEVVYASENIQDEETDELVRPLLQTLARRESADLSKLTARGQMSAIAAGSYHGSTPCWGYDYLYANASGEPYQLVRYLTDGSKEVYTPQGALLTRVPYGSKPPRAKGDSVRLVPSLPERVATIRRIFGMYVKERKGHRAIAWQLTSEGIQSPRCGTWGKTVYDGRWGVSTIRSILMNHAFIGCTAWNKITQGRFHKIADGKSVRRPRQEAGLSRPNPRSDWIIKEGTHEPLVSKELFDKAQMILSGRDRTAKFRHLLLGRGRTSNFLLTGLVRCTLCGGRFYGWSQKFRRKSNLRPEERHQVYVCGSYVRKGSGVCKRHAIEKAPFEEYILGRVHARLMEVLENGGRELLRSYVKEELESLLVRPEGEKERIANELAALKVEAERLLANLSAANREFIDERLLEIKRRRRELEADREVLLAKIGKPVDLEAAINDAMGYLNRFRDVLDQGTFMEKKEFLRGFVVGIDLDPEAKQGVLHMHDVVAASFSINGWTPDVLEKTSGWRGEERFRGEGAEWREAA
jgi:site-specific DNA recombinase